MLWKKVDGWSGKGRRLSGEEEEGRLGVRDLFTFVRGVMARAYAVNGATTNRRGVLSLLVRTLNLLGSC